MVKVSKSKTSQGDISSPGAEDVATRTSDGLADSVRPPIGGATQPSASGERAHATQREQQIAIRAYFKAQERGFPGIGQLDDWLAAEREFDDAYREGSGGQPGES